MVFFFLRTYQETPGATSERRDNKGQNKIAELNSMSPAILCAESSLFFTMFCRRFSVFRNWLNTPVSGACFSVWRKNIIVTAVYRITTALAMSATFTVTRYRFRFLYTDDGIRLSPHTALCYGGFLLVFVCAI